MYDLLEPGDAVPGIGRILDRLLIALIVVNVAAVVAESFRTLADTFAIGFRWIETISVVVFTVEYVLRMVTASHRYPGRSALTAAIMYAATPMALIDLAAILPFYVPFFIVTDLRFLRILRLTRILRVLKINRYSDALSIIATVLRRKASELLVTVFVTALLLLLSASIMYYLETGAQPDAFPNIIASFWWAVATLTTVGYGDVFPVTGWGRVVAGIIALLGIGLVALPTGIVSAGFLEEIQARTRDRAATGHRSGHSSRTKSRRKLYARRHGRTRSRPDRRS